MPGGYSLWDLNLPASSAPVRLTTHKGMWVKFGKLIAIAGRIVFTVHLVVVIAVCFRTRNSQVVEWSKKVQTLDVSILQYFYTVVDSRSDVYQVHVCTTCQY